MLADKLRNQMLSQQGSVRQRDNAALCLLRHKGLKNSKSSSAPWHNATKNFWPSRAAQ
jgi:hypothetical protein